MAFDGELPTRHPELSDHPELAQLAAWAQELRSEIPDHPLLALAATEVTEAAR